MELVGNEVEPDYIGLGSQGTLRGHCGWLVKNGVRGGGASVDVQGQLGSHVYSKGKG